MTTSKPTCASCPFFVSDRQASSDNLGKGMGRCDFWPGQHVAFPMQPRPGTAGAMAGAIGWTEYTDFPLMRADQSCGQHPVRRATYEVQVAAERMKLSAQG